MDTQQYRRILKEGDPNILHKDYKGVEWVEKEVKRVKAVSDSEEQIQEAQKIWWICDRVYYLVNTPPNGVNIDELYGFKHFERLYEELRDLKNKSPNPDPSPNQLSHCAECSNKSLIWHYIYDKRNKKLKKSYSNATDINNQWVFCNHGCFNKWKVKNEPNSKFCSECSKETTNTEEFCSKSCSLFSEVKVLTNKNYSNANSENLYQLAQKLLELAREYSKSLRPSLKPYCDRLIENLQKLVDNSYETWNSSTKLQEVSNYWQEKENDIGSKNLGLIKGTSYFFWPGTSYCFWNGYDWAKKTIQQRIETLESENETKDKNEQGECISCWECFKEIKTGASYWYHKSKNDGHKLCSNECYDQHYGEYCDKCDKKFLSVLPNGDNSYCSTCYELVKKEEQEKEEKEEQETRYCKYCSTKLEEDNPLKFCNSNACLIKFDKETREKNKDDAERGKLEKDIKKLRRSIQKLETKPNRTAEENNYLATKKQELEKLEEKLKKLDDHRKEDNNKTNSSKFTEYLPIVAISGGIFFFFLIILLVAGRSNRRSRPRQKIKIEIE